MPVTSLWRVKGDVASVIDYTTDEKKTKWATMDRKAVAESMEQQGGTDGEITVHDLHAVTDYAMRGNATVWRDAQGINHRLVSGINCDPDVAVDEMRRVKQKFGKPGGTVAYHGYQSFAEGEGPPDLIHQIGIETARRLWGDRYQVVVTTHVDHANHLHNHFVVNTVSFVDGKKFYRSAKDYAALRSVSDELAAQYGFCTLDNARQSKARDYTPGRTSWRKIVKADVDDAIARAMTDSHFYTILRAKGYEIKQGGQDISVRAPGAQRFLRLERNFGSEYARDAIRRRIVSQWATKVSKPQVRMKYRGSKFSPAHRGRKLHGFQALYIRYCFLLGAIPAKRSRPSSRVSPLLKKDLLRLKQISAQAQLLCRNQISTMEELTAYRLSLEGQISQLTGQRQRLAHQQRLAPARNNPETYQANRSKMAELSHQCRQIRKHLYLCRTIEEQSKEVAEKVKKARAKQRLSPSERGRNRYFGRR